jgi:hypothetical protein
LEDVSSADDDTTFIVNESTSDDLQTSQWTRPAGGRLLQHILDISWSVHDGHSCSLDPPEVFPATLRLRLPCSALNPTTFLARFPH